jgi:hypothetical protein
MMIVSRNGSLIPESRRTCKRLEDDIVLTEFSCSFFLRQWRARPVSSVAFSVVLGAVIVAAAVHFSRVVVGGISRPCTYVRCRGHSGNITTMILMHRGRFDVAKNPSMSYPFTTNANAL